VRPSPGSIVRGRGLVRGCLGLSGSIRSGLILRLMVTNGATGCRAEYTVMPRHMPGYAANRGTAQAASGAGRLASEGKEYGRADKNHHFGHLDPLHDCSAVVDTAHKTQRVTLQFDPTKGERSAFSAESAGDSPGHRSRRGHGAGYCTRLQAAQAARPACRSGRREIGASSATDGTTFHPGSLRRGWCTTAQG
jgi:hypothetical protein